MTTTTAVNWRHITAASVLVTAAFLGNAGVCLAAGFPISSSRNDIVPGQFLVDSPTLENLGFRWYVDGDGNRNAAVEVSYRQQGTTTWLQAQPMLRVRHEVVDDGKFVTGNLFAGSVLFLQPGTTYEVKFVMTDPDGGAAAPRTETVTTRSEPQAWAGGNTIPVGTSDSLMDAYDSAQPGDIIQLSAGVHNLQGLPYLLTKSGLPGKPIVFRGAGADQTTLQGPNYTTRMFCINADHIMFEDMTIRHTASFIITAANHLNDPDDAPFDDNYAAIGAKNLTVRYCRIEDITNAIWTASRYSSDWYIADNVIIGRNSAWYPFGSEIWLSHHAIDLYGQGHVVCHNKISWFGSLIGIVDAPNTDILDTVNVETNPVNVDIYNNELFHAIGDVIRIDYMAHNTRVYRNLACNGYTGISCQPIYGGPAYLLRNEIYGITAKPFKWHNTPAGLITAHNTTGSGMYSELTSNSHIHNNLFMGRFYGGTLTPDLHTMDYNGYLSETYYWLSEYNPGVTYPTMAAFTAATGYDEHGILISRSDFISAQEAVQGTTYTADDFDFRLLSTSNAIDNALRLDNINDDYLGSAPDRGAIEFGDDRPAYGPREHAPAYEPLPGDANYDDAVTLLDFLILKANFGTRTGATWSQGDFNGDGAVDLQDFGILKAYFGTSR